MVRRVLHMVREEGQREIELNTGDQTVSPFHQAASEADTEREEEGEDQGAGLLSKMLRQPGVLAVRALSLHNLLDQPPASSQLQPPPAVRGSCSRSTLIYHKVHLSWTELWRGDANLQFQTWLHSFQLLRMTFSFSKRRGQLYQFQPCFWECCKESAAGKNTKTKKGNGNCRSPWGIEKG